MKIGLKGMTRMGIAVCIFLVFGSALAMYLTRDRFIKSREAQSARAPVATVESEAPAPIEKFQPPSPMVFNDAELIAGPSKVVARPRPIAAPKAPSRPAAPSQAPYDWTPVQALLTQWVPADKAKEASQILADKCAMGRTIRDATTARVMDIIRDGGTPSAKESREKAQGAIDAMWEGQREIEELSDGRFDERAFQTLAKMPQYEIACYGQVIDMITGRE